MNTDPTPAAGPQTGALPRVLVVEDEVLNLLYLEDRLQELGFTTVLAVNGLDALSKLEAAEVDVVLTDLRMPRMSGQDLVRRLGETWPTLPVVVMTGVPEEAAGMPVVAVFAKPLDVVRLAKALASAAQVP